MSRVAKVPTLSGGSTMRYIGATRLSPRCAPSAASSRHGYRSSMSDSLFCLTHRLIY